MSTTSSFDILGDEGDFPPASGDVSRASSPVRPSSQGSLASFLSSLPPRSPVDSAIVRANNRPSAFHSGSERDHQDRHPQSSELWGQEKINVLLQGQQILLQEMRNLQQEIRWRRQTPPPRAPEERRPHGTLNRPPPPKRCAFCSGPHFTRFCEMLAKFPTDRKMMWLAANGHLCRVCLRGHPGRCRLSIRCRYCSGPHLGIICGRRVPVRDMSASRTPGGVCHSPRGGDVRYF